MRRSIAPQIREPGSSTRVRGVWNPRRHDAQSRPRIRQHLRCLRLSSHFAPVDPMDFRRLRAAHRREDRGIAPAPAGRNTFGRWSSCRRCPSPVRAAAPLGLSIGWRQRPRRVPASTTLVLAGGAAGRVVEAGDGLVTSSRGEAAHRRACSRRSFGTGKGISPDGTSGARPAAALAITLSPVAAGADGGQEAVGQAGENDVAVPAGPAADLVLSEAAPPHCFASLQQISAVRRASATRTRRRGASPAGKS